MGEYPRGSEWRRWDLHIHTPETIKNDQFEGKTVEEKWSKYYEDISKYIGYDPEPDKDIAVIGITDYLSINNYKKVIADGKLPTSVKFVLPNIEMRIQPIAKDSPINIHFLFDPNFVDQIESRFFSKITFPYGGTNFTANKNELIRLGKTSDSTLSEENAYIKGINLFVVSFDAVKSLFDNDPDLRKHVLIGVSNNTSDGVTGATNHSDYILQGESQLKAFRESVYKFVDFIFSSQPSDITYFLGKKPTCPASSVIDACGAIMPCVHGSDAHKNIKIFEPDQRRYCWIKADPTFEGLKQITFEPEERIRISESKPETKPDYYVIDNIIFEDEDFQDEPIYFSDQLTCIIGGKSTGKSILIQNMAQVIDKIQTGKHLTKAINKTKTDVKMKISWRDGKQAERKIIYIPQTYLNKLSDEKEEQTEIDGWVIDILLKYPAVNDAQSEFLSKIKEYKSILGKMILDVISVDKDYQNATKNKMEIGDKQGIETEIEKLKRMKDKLTEQLNLSEEDVKKYDVANSQILSLQQKRKELIVDRKAIDSMASLISINPMVDPLSGGLKAKIRIIQAEIEKTAIEAWNSHKKDIIGNIDNEMEKLEVENKKHCEIIESLKDKIESSIAVKELTQKINNETKKLSDLGIAETVEQNLKAKRSELLKELSESVNFFKDTHIQYANVINENRIENDGLSFYAETPFRQTAFIEKLALVFNNRTPEYKKLIRDDFDESSYTPDFMLAMLENILDEKLQLKSAYATDSAFREILDNWFNIVYRVEMDKDPINLMSPGKKALALLKILISLAESKCPILIDQPEDDLDNRSIYDDLITFIKEKKKERQIIIVTHNANIVLGGDAETVIVANQDGEKTPNNNKRFEYRGGSIENNIPLYKTDGSKEEGILNQQGIQQHICDILEGGEAAFEIRKKKYRI